MHCSHCGYDLRGHPHSRKCPECGKRQRRRRGLRAEHSLARESYRVILGCLWRELLALASFVLIGLGIVLGPLHGGDVLLWCLALLPFPLALTTVMRTSPALVAPGHREQPVPKRIRQVIRTAGLLLVGLGAVTVVLLASVGPTAAAPANASILPVLLLAGIASIIVAIAGIWAYTNIDLWVMDDRAQWLHELSMWMFLLVGVLFPGALYVLANFSGTFTRPFGISFIGVVGWWLMIVLGDISLILSTVWCLRHRMHYDEIDDRRDARDERGREQVRRRLDAMDRPGEG